MNKFDLHNYFFIKELKNPNEENTTEDDDQNPSQSMPVPGQAASATAQNPQQNAGQGNKAPDNNAILKNQNAQNSNVFSNFVGSTISDMSFKKTGGNGGEISISISKSNMPIKISWVGDKVTVTQPNGNIISL